MKTTKLLFVLTLSVLIASCGGNKRTNTTEQVQNSDTANVAIQKQSPEITTEKKQNSDTANVATQNQSSEMTISISDKEPCDGGSFILKIKGGTPFSTGKPFIVESKEIGGSGGKLYLGTFTNKNGVYTMKIGTGVNGMESDQQLTVTDSKGVKKTANFTILDCP